MLGFPVKNWERSLYLLEFAKTAKLTNGPEPNLETSPIPCQPIPPVFGGWKLQDTRVWKTGGEGFLLGLGEIAKQVWCGSGWGPGTGKGWWRPMLHRAHTMQFPGRILHNPHPDVHLQQPPPKKKENYNNWHLLVQSPGVESVDMIPSKRNNHGMGLSVGELGGLPVCQFRTCPAGATIPVPPSLYLCRTSRVRVEASAWGSERERERGQ